VPSSGKTITKTESVKQEEPEMEVAYQNVVQLRQP
jgi:hypothetical protein